MTPALILITDPRYSDERTARVVREAAGALGPGKLLVQLRDKVSPPDVVARSAHALHETTKRVGAPLVVNGDVALARSFDGVHLGGARPDIEGARRALGAEAWISVAAHDDDDVRWALAHRASAVLVSPIFATEGKGPPRGVAAIARARQLVHEDVAIYALGGVGVSTAATCEAADGVAVIRALLDSADVAGAASALAAPFVATKKKSGYVCGR